MVKKNRCSGFIGIAEIVIKGADCIREVIQRHVLIYS